MTHIATLRVLLTSVLVLTFGSKGNCATKPSPLDRPARSLSVGGAGFEENKGQVLRTNGEQADFVRFRLVQEGASIFLLNNGIAYQFSRKHYPAGYAELKHREILDPAEQTDLDALRKEIRNETFRMDVVLVGANADPLVTTENRSADCTNYYTHDALDVSSFGHVTYHDVYPGIDWVLYIMEAGFKYDFIIHPGADPALIDLRFDHQEELYLNDRGGLVHGNRLGWSTEEAPVSYQGTRAVATRFALDGNHLRFVLGDYDNSKVLTIDPARLWGTYYGGSGTDEGHSCAIDASGNIYLAGETSSATAIADGGYQTTYGGGASDAFLAKFNAEGIRLWATYYGGDSTETRMSCAVDASGNCYLAGSTLSTTSIASGGHQNAFGGDLDAFLVKFAPDGTRLWATYYGGDRGDRGRSCAVDGSGNIYMSGSTSSTSNIADGGFQNTFGGGGFNTDAFLVKFDPSGTRLWGTYYGDLGNDIAFTCATAVDGSILIAGGTYSQVNMATPGAHQPTVSSFGDAFLAKFDGAGARQWATYYGGSSNDYAEGLATDSNGNIYMAGLTLSGNAIASGGHQNARDGFSDAFLIKFSPTGARLWGTYYGGTQSEDGFGCAVDGDDNVYLTGFTASANGIASGGYQNSYGGAGISEADAFVVKFNSAGTRLWGTYYGADGVEESRDCAITANGDVVFCGTTNSSIVIAENGQQNTLGGDTDAFLVRLDPSNVDAIGERTRGALLSLMPNPNSGNVFYVEIGEDATGAGALYLEMLDASGKLMYATRINPDGKSTRIAVDLGGKVPTGVYLVRITSDSVTYTGRSVVQP
ncbi:MAG: SBBP repeat-containing protein [Flavobacteriales bacterium]|nr:SBBP repeat-containing protein [Flavobacteriales bacterium]